MKEQLPTYMIDGRDYWVDLRKCEFRCVECPPFIIPFDLLTLSDSGYRLIYDKKYELHSNNLSLLSEPGRASITEIPPLYKLDPLGMERKYGSWKGNTENVNDRDWIIQAFLQKKMVCTNYPILLMDGREYSLDYTNKKLIPRHIESSTFTKEKNVAGEIISDGVKIFDLNSRRIVPINKNDRLKKVLPAYGVSFDFNHTNNDRMRKEIINKYIQSGKLLESINHIFSSYALIEIFKFECKSELFKSHYRKLALYKVDHTEFEVNIRENCIQVANNRTNRIYFDQMNYVEDHYEFRFDRITQRLAAPFDTLDQDISVEKIPGKNVLDPDYMATEYNLRYESLQSSTDFEIQVPQDHFQRRMNGELPIIKTDPFCQYTVDIKSKINALANVHLVDFKNGKMISQHVGFPDIELPQINNYQDPVVFFYDLKAKKVTELNNHPLEYVNENIIVIKLPPPIEVDPIYSAMCKGWDIKTTLLKYAINRENYLETFKADKTSQKLISKNSVTTENKIMNRSSIRRSF